MDTNGNGTAVPWTESEAGKQLQARLSEKRTLEAIDRLLDRIDTLEEAVDRLSTVMRQGPGLVAMVGDMVDETYRQSDARGVSIDERLTNALQLAEKLTAPAMVEKIDGLLKITDQLPGLVAMFGDMTDEAYRQADAQGVSIDQRLGVALQLAERLTAPEMAARLENALQLADQMPGMMAMTVDMVDEGMREAMDNGFDPQSLSRVAGAAGTALTRAQGEAPAKAGGIFGLMRALKDPDRQLGLGFLLNFLKHFGKNLQK